MSRDEPGHELPPEATNRISAVDGYLEDAIQGGRPIEALTAIRWLGDIANRRSREAARAATEGAWSWSDVGGALGMSKQAAHEKLRARVHDEIAKGLSKIEEAQGAGHAKISRRARRGQEQLDRAAPFSPKVDSARQRIDEWEQSQHERLDRKVEKARRETARTERSVQEKLDRKGKR